MQRLQFQHAGFTLVEMIMVMVITGIIASMVAVFIRVPVDAYLDTARRAELTDEADASLRFIARELKAALPNSIRCDSTGTPRYIEFIPVNSGGRYREHPTSAGAGTPLEFGVNTTSFDLIGKGQANSASTQTAHASATAGTVVVGNLSKDPSNACSAYVGDNASALSSIDGVTGAVTIAPKNIPNGCNLETAAVVDDTGTANNEENDRGAGRFFVVGGPVLYACGPGGLLRYAGYSASSGPGVSAPSGSPAILAGRVSACDLACDGVNARIQTISFRITVTSGGESLQLFRQVRVENLP